MIQRPSDMGGFQFVVLATLRAAQLLRGCTPRVEGRHKATMTALFEVAEGKVLQMVVPPTAALPDVTALLEPVAAVRAE